MHLHAWVRGSDLDVEACQRACAAAGIGREFDLRPLDGRTHHNFAYIFRALLLPPDGDEICVEAERHLDLNGGGVVRASAGFWLDKAGEPLRGGVRAARREARGGCRG